MDSLLSILNLIKKFFKKIYGEKHVRVKKLQDKKI